MAVQQITFTRGGKDYIAHRGQDANGRNVEYIEEVLKYANSLTGRFFPTRKEIDYVPGEGNEGQILSYFQHALFADNGEMVTDPKDFHPDFGTLMLRTNATDLQDFTNMFAAPVSVFDFNGFVRGIMGFNNYKLFDSATGQLLTWTAEQLAEPPTHDYDVPVPVPAEPEPEPTPEP